MSADVAAARPPHRPVLLPQGRPRCAAVELPALTGCFHIGTDHVPLPLEHYHLSSGDQVALLMYGQYPLLALLYDPETELWLSLPIPSTKELLKMGARMPMGGVS